MSLFDVIGPVMIGPSSSHTAGAAKIGFLAQSVLGKPFLKARITLYNSFAKTGLGHGTDKAIVGGLLGFRMDDERIARSLEIAKENKIEIEFIYEQDPEKHPNEVRIEFFSKSPEPILTISGQSIGGGAAKIVEINDTPVWFGGKHDVLIIQYKDVPGMVGFFGEVLGDHQINIAYMDITRDAVTEKAMALLKLDQYCPDEVVKIIRQNTNVLDVISIRRLSDVYTHS